MAASDKKALNVSPDQSYGLAAHRILSAGLSDVLHWLPLAAQTAGSEESENVHKLRVATRRSVVALKSFKKLVSEEKCDSMRESLRRIRKAADVARNVDVCAERFLGEKGDLPAEFRAKLEARLAAMRAEAQHPIVAVHAALSESGFANVVQALLDEIQTRHPKRAAVSYGHQARKILVPPLKKFFKVARTDIANEEEFHRLRIEAKKLRYAMEIVAAAYSPDFKNKLLRQFCKYQDVMGTVRDHVIAEELLRGWLATPCEDSERAFVEGMLIAESKGHVEMYDAFKTLWTKDTIDGLRNEFATHLGSKF